MEKKYSGFPMRFAHTGITQVAPENTFEAYKRAAELGCEGIECDINMSKDGEIILIHNNNLGFVTFDKNKTKLCDMTVEEIKQVDIPFKDAFLAEFPPIPWTEHDGGLRQKSKAGSKETRVTHLMTFPEFDAWLSTLDYFLTVEVEFKQPGMCDRMDEIITASGNASHYIFFSGEEDVLEDMQEHYRKKGKPEGLRLGANIRYINDKTMEFVKKSDLWEVGLNNEAFTKEDVDMLNGMGIKVFSNLGDYVEWWEQLEIMGVTGFKTNYAEVYTNWWMNKQ